MTNEELCKALRAIDHMSLEDCFLQSPYFTKAADRIELLATTNEQLVATNEALVMERDGLRQARDDWRDDFKSLSAAIVGDTGLSAMTVALQARLYRPRAEAAEALIADCADYLKEGETPRQRMDRDHKDVLALMDMLAKEKMKREAAEAALVNSEAVLKEAVDTINNLRELNTTAEDENGHRWANSDMAEQEIVAFLTKHQISAEQKGSQK